MSTNFSTSKTKENLMKAFAGESQARNRYTFAKNLAKQQHSVKLCLECIRIGNLNFAKLLFYLLIFLYHCVLLLRSTVPRSTAGNHRHLQIRTGADLEHQLSDLYS